MQAVRAPFILLASVSVTGCQSDPEPTVYSCLSDGLSTEALWGGAHAEPELLFQSGFEEGVRIEPLDSEYSDIVGVDSSVASLGDWEADLEADPIGRFKVYFEEGNDSQRAIELVPDPADADNQALSFRLHQANVRSLTSADKGRIQFGLNNNVALYALSYSVRMRFEQGIGLLSQHPERITWLTVAEFWNNTANKAFPFRITLNVNKEEGVGQPLFWNMHAQTRRSPGQWDTLWHGAEAGVPVPIKSWFTLHVDLQEGCAGSGRFRVRMTEADGTEHTIVDATNITQHPNDPDPDGFASFNPVKLYTSGKTIDWVRGQGEDLVILWDDFKLYRGSAAP